MQTFCIGLYILYFALFIFSWVIQCSKLLCKIGDTKALISFLIQL